MVEIIDTNIFILSTYSSLHVKAVEKFLSEQKDPIPYSLFDEITDEILTLLVHFQKIKHDLEKGIKINQIQELKDLLPKYDNIHFFLKQKSNNFKNLKKLIVALDKGIKNLITISSWADTVKYYPPNEKQEKDILKKYTSQTNKLKKLPEIHYGDLKIIVILHHFYKKSDEKVRFVTRDKKSLIRRKKEIEKEFYSVELITVSKYLSK